jgi:hypothetical protein
MHLLQMNSSREIIVVENIEVPTGPNMGSGVDDPLFQSESFRSPTHTVGIFNPRSAPSSVRDIFSTLGMSSNQPMASQIHKMFVTYTIPLDHFTGTTSNFTMISNHFLVGSHSILPLQMAHSTMVPQATTISTRNVAITQSPIGARLPLRPNPSLPPGYNALNTSISIPTQNPYEGSRHFVPPGYNVASQFVPTPAQVLSGGPYIPPPPFFIGSNHPGPSGSNPIGGTSHSVTFGFQIPARGQTQAGGNFNFGGNLRSRDNLKLEGNLKLEAITQFMEKVYMHYNINLGIFLSKGINNRLGGNILKLILLYPLISGNHIQAL